MGSKLGDLLIQEGAITRKQLDEALKCQVIFGGRLGTNLVEMGYIEEQKLVEFLSKQLDAPYVTPEQLSSITPDVINLISKDLAAEYKIIPISLDKKRLTVAIWDPSDLSALDAISFITGYIIRPLVCSELRLLLALEQYYGIKREVRYIQMKGGSGNRSREDAPNAPGKSGAGIVSPEHSPFHELMDDLPPAPPSDTGESDSDWGDAHDFQPPGSGPGPLLKITLPEKASDPLLGVEPGLIDLEPLGTSTVPTQPPVERPAPPIFQQPVVQPAPPVSQPPMDKPLPTPAPAAPEKTTTATDDTLLSTLAEAGSRDAIADALVGFLGREFDRVALFMVKGRAAVGWRGVLNNASIAGFENLHVPLEDPTLLKVVTDTKNFYLGPILEAPGNARILAGLGGGQPDSVLLIPLLMMERVVAVFYVDGDKELLGRKLFELQKLVGKASLAFEIMILKNKILLA